MEYNILLLVIGAMEWKRRRRRILLCLKKHTLKFDFFFGGGGGHGCVASHVASDPGGSYTCETVPFHCLPVHKDLRHTW